MTHAGFGRCRDHARDPRADPPQPPSKTTPPPGSPPTPFALAGLIRDKRKRTASLAVDVPGPGTLVLGGRGVVGGQQAVGAAGSAKLLVKATGKTKRALRRRQGRVAVEVTFTPTGGDASTQARTGTLVKASR